MDIIMIKCTPSSKKRRLCARICRSGRNNSKDYKLTNSVMFTIADALFAECWGHSAKPAKHSAKVSRQRSYRQKFLCRVPKIDTRQSLCRVPDTRQSWNWKKPEKIGIFTPKNGKFVLIGGGPHQSAPIHLWLFRVNFTATRLTGFEPETSRCALSLVSGFCFSS